MTFIGEIAVAEDIIINNGIMRNFEDYKLGKRDFALQQEAR